MEITFLGAAGTVTGSKYLLSVGQQRILVDCGMFQSVKLWREKNWEPFFVPPETINAVLITHAHIDHIGYLPRLVQKGFHGPILATQATLELSKILLRDSADIQEEDARLANLYGYSKHKPALPLYTLADAEAAIKLFRPVEWGKPYGIGKEFSATWSHAGHILGAAMIQCQCDGRQILFSGDLGRMHDSVMEAPVNIQYTDYLVLESTYGDRLHEHLDPLEKLAEIINQTARRGGSILIPAFAVGRAQNLLYYIYQLRSRNRIPHMPFYLDSPMAITASEVFCHFHKEHKLSAALCQQITKMAIYTHTLEESLAIHNSSMPKVIISASGMATGGRVLHHLKDMAPDPKHTILIAGFQAPDTRGARLVKGATELQIHGQTVPVRARVEFLPNTSAHADYEEILEWLRGFVRAPRAVFITHGERDSAHSLKAKIEAEFGWDCSVPDYLQSVTL